MLQLLCLSALVPIAQSTSSQELEGRGSFIATFKSSSQSLLVLSEILDDFEVLELFERNFDEPPTVAMCKPVVLSA